MTVSARLEEVSQDAQELRQALRELMSSVDAAAGRPRSRGDANADSGFKQMKAAAHSQAAMAAQKAMERAKSLRGSVTFIAALGIVAAVLWGGLWLYVNSDWALGRLTEIHVPKSVRLPDAAIQAVGSQGESFAAVAEQLTALTHGTLPKMLALAMFIMGAGMGVVKQSIAPVVTGITGALIFTQGPLLLDQLVSGPNQAQMGGTAVSVFERDKDLERLRKSLSAQALSPHNLSYLLGQAIVMEAGKNPVPAMRSDELKSHIDMVRQALASRSLVDGKAHAVYAMEVAAYGKGTTGEAGDLQRNVDTVRRIFAKLHPGWLLLGWCTPLLLLLIAMGVAFDRAKLLAEAADPASARKAAERFRKSLMANPHAVPFVRTSDSRDIEATIKAIEMEGGASAG